MKYPWRCVNCGSEVTVNCLVSERDKTPPSEVTCRGEDGTLAKHQYERQLTVPTFRLAGGGWFKDGYSKENKK
jgi:hypothetical protein